VTSLESPRNIISSLKPQKRLRGEEKKQKNESHDKHNLEETGALLVD
jgi:hypothetical protein